MTDFKLGRPPLYPWEYWLDGEIHTLYKDADFNGELKSFRVAAHREAAKHGLKVKTEMNHHEHSITIRAYQAKKGL